MNEQHATPSPWWYRNRALVIGLIFFAGFFLGNVRFDPGPSLPAAIVWGMRWGNSGTAAIMWSGIVLVVLAWLARLSGTAYLRGAVVFAPDVQRDRLIVAGPFRYVRNPLYLGNDLMAAGVGVFAPPLGFAIVVIGNIVFGMVLAREEERQLRAQYGADFVAYKTAVPSFIPRLMPASVASVGTITPFVRAAFFSESFTLAIALGLVPIAIAGQAGLITAAGVFALAGVLFNGASWIQRRNIAPL